MRLRSRGAWVREHKTDDPRITFSVVRLTHSPNDIAACGLTNTCQFHGAYSGSFPITSLLILSWPWPAKEVESKSTLCPAVHQARHPGKHFFRWGVWTTRPTFNPVIFWFYVILHTAQNPIKIGPQQFDKRLPELLSSGVFVLISL